MEPGRRSRLSVPLRTRSNHPGAARGDRRRWLGVLLAAWPATLTAQPATSPPTLRDTLVMRLVAFRAPCPAPAPAAWSMLDSTLGTGLRCSLVEAAARALSQRLRTRPEARYRDADPWRPLCVRLVELQNTGSTGLPGDWMVVFDLTPALSADVIIDRQSGSLMAGMVGDGVQRWGPPCAGRPPPR